MIKYSQHNILVRLCVIALSLIMGLVSALGTVAGNGIEGKDFPPLSVEPEQAPSAGLCGINCLYVALRLWGDDKYSFEQLVSFFPNSQEKGTSLAQLRLFLEKEGYHCKITKFSDEKLRKSDEKTLVFYLIERSNEAHIILKKRVASGSIQLIDPPNIITYRDKDQNAPYPDEYIALTASPNPVGNGFDPYLTGLVLTGVFSVILIYSFCSKKKKIVCATS